MVKSRRQGVLGQKGQKREEINQSYSKDIAKKTTLGRLLFMSKSRRILSRAEDKRC